MGAFLTYALNKDGDLVHVDSVEKGAKCACFCPHCNAPLYAKNAGQYREHHFAHAQGHECEGAYESSLHLLAKDVLQEVGQVMLPPSINGAFPSGLVRIHNIEVEKWDERFGFRPDVEGIMDNGERLLIEFYVSHKVDKKKRQSIVDNHLKCIEINVNYQSLDRDELKEFLTTSSEDREWIVSIPPQHKNEGESSYSFSYTRNPLYDTVRDKLKERFDSGSLIIHPFKDLLARTDTQYDLRQYNYDVCEVGTQYRGFKSDLLLYRSQMKDMGHISINIRGRRRAIDFKRPEGLRVIDIVLKYDFMGKSIKDLLESGDLTNREDIMVNYTGFNK